jgi:hypothetical protein
VTGLHHALFAGCAVSVVEAVAVSCLIGYRNVQAARTGAGQLPAQPSKIVTDA